MRRFVSTAVILTLVAGPAMAGASGDPPSARCAPVSGPAGGRVSVRSAGFEADEAVDVFLGAAESRLVVAGTDGRVNTFGVDVPTDAEPGRRWISLVGRLSSRTARCSFDVLPWPWPSWPMEGADAAATGAWSGEAFLGDAILPRLSPAWTAEGSDLEPLLIGRTVVIRGAGITAPPSLSAVDAWTGAPRWTWTEPLDAPVGVAADGDSLLLHTGRQLFGLDPTSGAVDWMRYVAPIGSESAGRPAVLGGVVFLASRRSSGVRTNATLTAFDLEELRVAWTRELVEEGLTWPVGGPVITDDRVILPVREGVAVFGARLGSTVWARPWLGETLGVTTDGSNVDVTYVARGPRATGHVGAFDLGSGAPRWDAALAAGARPGAPAIGDDVVVLGWAPYDEGMSDSGVQARRASDGTLLWRHASAWPTAATIVDGRAFVGTDDGFLRVYTLSTGATVSAVSVEGTPIVRPVIGASATYLSTREGSLVALRPTPVAPPPIAELRPDPGLLPDPTSPIDPQIHGWRQAAELGPSAGSAIASLAPFGGRLFVGTRVDPRGRGASEIWMTVDGRRFRHVMTFAGASSIRLESYGGQLFAAPEREGRSTLYASSDGRSFAQVPTFAQGPDLGRITPIGGERRMLVVAESALGPRAWSSIDGSTFTPLETGVWGAAGTVFALDAIAPWGHGVVFEGARYLGASSADGGELWRIEGDTIERVAVDGIDSRRNRRLQPQLVFGGWLYVVSSGPDGLGLFRTDDGIRYRRLVRPGFGGTAGRNLNGTLAVGPDGPVMATVNRETRRITDAGALEIARSRGFEVWRSGDGVAWSREDDPGFGNPHDRMATISEVGGVLYLTVTNHREGDAVWRSDDGIDWRLLFRERGTTPLSVPPALTQYDGHLLLLLGDLEEGPSIWRFGPGIPVDLPRVASAPTGSTTWRWVAAGIAALVGMVVIVLLMIDLRRHRGRHRPRRPPRLHRAASAT